MQCMECVDEKKGRIHDLVGEVLRGEHKKDILINSSYSFEKEVQATYFSNMRKNMSSDTAYAIMNTRQQLEDLKILKGLNKYE